MPCKQILPRYKHFNKMCFRPATFYKICIVTIVHTSNFLQDCDLLQINVTTENTITIVFSLVFLHVS